MITILEALIMSILQGIVEWLPISSEGHLSLLLINFYGISELNAISLALFLHLGTMVAVLWQFRDDFFELIKDIQIRKRLTKTVIIATIGTAITAVPIVLFFKEYWEDFSSQLPISAGTLFTGFIGFFLIITGVLLAKQPDQGTRELSSLTNRETLLLGMAQGIAALPGISRSGMTITVLLFIGLTQREALRTSFIISVPAVMGATVLEFILEGLSFTTQGMVVGTVEISYFIIIFSLSITAIVGLLSMKFLLSLKNVPYDKFCFGFGGGTLLLALILITIELFF